MLVVFGGLSGTGKTTIARAIAIRRSASYLRIDVIEQALRSAGAFGGDFGPAGYIVGNALAASNLANGQTVIVDCVNPVIASRTGWQATARRAGAVLIEIEVVCSDVVEHRRRVEDRKSDIAGLVVPTWQDVVDREYAPWTDPHIVVDTARLTADQAVELIEQYMDA
jgi:predicted kinase